MLCTDRKGFLAAQDVFLMFFLTPQSFVAVEPLGLSQVLVVLVEMESTIWIVSCKLCIQEWEGKLNADLTLHSTEISRS